MAMNSSGPISLGGATAGQSINLENGFSATAQVSLNDTAVRNLAGVASGAITMPTNFYGKSNRVSASYTFASNTANASLNLSTVSGYSAGKTDITVTVSAGIYLYATSTGNYGLNLTGGTTGDTLTIVNNGYIMGQGGTGGMRFAGSTTAPTAGGPAINFGFGLSGATVTNTSGYIGGGGGGGGLGNYYVSGGGGAGGGAGGNASEGNGSSATGGSGGGVGSSGGNGTVGYSTDPSYGGVSGVCAGGGGGGRIMPGSGGNTFASGYGYPGGGGGAGGAGANAGSGNNAGGSAGSAGTSGTSPRQGGGGGGGYGASGGTGDYPSTGASGGKAINLNAKSITWTGGSASSSRAYGAVS